jgi:hypothetical protein
MYLYGMVLVLDLCFAYVLGWDGPHRVTQQKSNIPLFLHQYALLETVGNRFSAIVIYAMRSCFHVIIIVASSCLIL